ncbi:hypothetical protein HGH92_09905 [Chitinophaga varians]|uniref:Uncharacterized protein n=1 Tax=Chitinophaga varians TaxID=2202339 RepID=A0A847RC25_9BACT|nr:hypothetical protein [Chitinophaga varians]NLR64619.1 hypothetical protein [Chitinophaga varians]
MIIQNRLCYPAKKLRWTENIAKTAIRLFGPHENKIAGTAFTAVGQRKVHPVHEEG